MCWHHCRILFATPARRGEDSIAAGESARLQQRRGMIKNIGTQGKGWIMKRKTLKIIGLSLLAGVIVGMGLLARPLVDRLVESVAATDQERNS
jgi:hypothetical protein